MRTCRYFETLSYLPPLSDEAIAKQVCFWTTHAHVWLPEWPGVLGPYMQPCTH